MNIFLNQSGTDLVKKSELLKKFIATHKDYSSVSIYNKTGVKIADNKGIRLSKNVSNESFSEMRFKDIFIETILNQII
jgi:hypothetical protein